MATCTFSSSFHIYDVTPVENIFIQEFMLKAPGDFIKVYLYGLSKCYHYRDEDNSIDGFSKALNLDSKLIEHALQYWERQGIIKINRTRNEIKSIEYQNIKDMLFNNNESKAMDDSLYQYRDFNQNLEFIFDKRLLSPQEYLKIYNWIEVLGLPEEVVLMMIQFYVGEKGDNLSIKYLDKVADSWAKEGINTLLKVEEYISRYESHYKDTLAVLKYMGIHRNPSRAELDLYKKWHETWGLNLESILTAAKETTKTHSPNMAYLDKIVESFYKLNITTSHKIEDYLDNKDSISNKVRDVLYNLGSRNMAQTPEHHAQYYRWIREYDMEHDVIILACKQMARKRSKASMEDLDRLLAKWSSMGLKNSGDIMKYIENKKLEENEIKIILERAGEDRPVRASDYTIFKKWTEEWNFSYELILLAAEYSIMADEKMPFINKILNNWYDDNISTIREAKLDNERHLKKYDHTKSDGLSKAVDFNKFEQHEYDDDDFDDLFEDLDSDIE